MESFQGNKVFGDVYCRYLKSKFGWNYETVVPQLNSIPSNYPDVDLILNSKEREVLYLQLKQPMEFEKQDRILTKSWIKIFKNYPFEDAIIKAEENYIKKGKNIHNIILILHIGLFIGYSIPSDNIFINNERLKNSTFRGIYLVSPEHELWDEKGKEIQNEFICEGKNAFV